MYVLKSISIHLLTNTKYECEKLVISRNMFNTRSYIQETA